MILRKYFETGTGTIPIVLSCSHGGYKKPKSLLNKKIGPQIADKNTYIIAKWLINNLKEKNCSISYLLSKIHRSKIDLNRPPVSESAFNQESNEARSVHNAYHSKLVTLVQDCISIHKKCLLIDLHGFTKPTDDYPDIIFGHLFSKTLHAQYNDSNQDYSQYWGCAQLEQEISKIFVIDNGMALSDFNLSYSGGYITQKFYNQPNVSAIQIEIAKYIRKDYDLTKNFINGITKSIEKLLDK
ncbi:MAG: N-formylglutamate amidohydrolase [Candidatus Lokiarchaeota archaeon]|nr:N-formylglutamate amidohydrolase [Candidatus Lokiarchaeota archaeon]